MNAPIRPSGREVLHCTCALGKCSRPGHRPLSAQCGHPGIFAHHPGTYSAKGESRSVCHRDACHLVAIHLTSYFPTQEAVGRAIGKLTGATGRKGGWIYNPAGQVLCQGWASYAHHQAGVVRVVDGGRTASTFDFTAGEGYRISEEGLRRVANHLSRLEARSSS